MHLTGLRLSCCILITVFHLFGSGVYAQQSAKSDLVSLRLREDSLKILSDQIISGREAVRQVSCRQFFYQDAGAGIKNVKFIFISI